MRHCGRRRGKCWLAWIVTCGVSILTASPAGGAILEVPSSFPTIQSAINSSIPNDTVLVAPGTYFENIQFFGIPVLLTSEFLFDKDPVHIAETIIDGSMPSDPDAASVIRITFGEDSSLVIQGFTITGGAGTVWVDPHGFGTYREGGGILSEFSSPIIQHNWIIDNEAIVVDPGLVSAGGGGIRAGDGNPIIRNNLIANNRGRYGAGIVLNFADGVVRNNIITGNTGGEDFGGSGIWKYEGGNAEVENNTIIGNVSALGGGGVYAWSTTMTLRNNIIRGNVASSFPQIRVSASTVSVTYCNVEGGFAGMGNIDADPAFVGPHDHLGSSSQCIDAGDPGAAWNEPEDPESLGSALWPALGGLRSDMGAFGGVGSWDIDGDVDGDSVFNTMDNCPFSPNPLQEDIDGDGIGDACDNCPAVANSDQADMDSDGFGAVCDCADEDAAVNPNSLWYPDGDGDGYGDSDAVPVMQCAQPFGGVLLGGDCNDSDNAVHPGRPEVCNGIDDNCDGVSDDGFADEDSDGVGNSCDNCPGTFNPDQADTNNNGLGDVCECDCPHQCDLDASSLVDAVDLAVEIDIVFFGATDVSDPLCPASRADFNSDGLADAVDLANVIDYVFFGAAGPIDPCAL